MAQNLHIWWNVRPTTIKCYKVWDHTCGLYVVTALLPWTWNEASRVVVESFGVYSVVELKRASSFHLKLKVHVCADCHFRKRSWCVFRAVVHQLELICCCKPQRNISDIRAVIWYIYIRAGTKVRTFSTFEGFVTFEGFPTPLNLRHHTHFRFAHVL